MFEQRMNRRCFLAGAGAAFTASALVACTPSSIGSAVLTPTPTVRTGVPAGKLVATIVEGPIVAVDKVCAWPNLTLLPNGDITALIFNQPTHWGWPGNIDCWASADGGRHWERRAQVTEAEPNTARGNLATGLAYDGALITVISGWSYKGTVTFGQQNTLDKILDPWVCRSTDGGRNWTIEKEQVAYPTDAQAIIPFGDIVPAADGRLAMTIYTWDYSGRSSVYLLWSTDDGHSWGQPTLIGADDYNETDILSLGEGQWLAASRTRQTGQLKLFASADGGQTWADQGLLTKMQQHPADLERLADGRILLVYGNRTSAQYGVDALVSDDGGRTWSERMQLANLKGATDAGYPSSVQLADGTLVTAYYAQGAPYHPEYHMGVVRWRLD